MNRNFEGCLRNHWWNCISEKDSQLMNLWEAANEKIEDDLNVVKVIKHLRALHIAVTT